ncbi:serine/threonine protein kinase [Corallococcus sp. H22C18031201]|uniref:serine/threonine-protein kinase n=1 Tax=Citreicoccus inhibens TaxID=2849499 RepID=UPI000E746BB6|nr:serine/threonine-protein kinase [Citreicoccus inhibens]MBU8900397.1 protein kinase [Citreicoccus inhibens]RJS25051.1 serine/threonine protein kinase [Corallococcus sp. H22C18031201]
MTRSTDGDLQIDSVLRNTYKVISVLGRGGMGSVFLAQHLRLPGKQVAVKVLRTSENLSPEIHARFRREAEIASRLGHPNIVEVLDFDALEDGSPFLVLEYLRGESLADRLRRGRLSLDETVSFVRQMGSALQTAHRAGVVHRDLKPANVFLVPTDSGGVVGERVKLLDFGISKVMSSDTLQTQEAVLIGTPQYMSPEQAQGRNRQIDARTDLFALGGIVFEMLAGMTPFGGGSLAELIYRIVHEPPLSLATLVPGTPPSVVAAVERALAKNPDERFQDIGAFVSALTGTPLQSLPPSAAVLEAMSAARPSPSGIALPSDDPPSLSGTIAPGSQSSARPPPNTARFGPQPSAPASSGTMGFGAAPAAQAAPSPAPDDTFGLGATMASQQAPVPPPVAATALPASLAASPVPPVTGPASLHAQPALAVPAASTPPPTKSKLPVVAAATALLVGAAGLGWWLRPTPPSQVSPPEPSPTVAERPSTPPPPTHVAPPPAQVPTRVEPPPTANPTPAPTPEVTPRDAKPPPSQVKPVIARPVVAEKIPDEVRIILQEGERALEKGDAREAIRQAQLSQRTKITAASYSLLTRAYCKGMDLAGAKPNRKKVAPAEADRVDRYCKLHGIEF